jgi:hypothetical protein
MVLEVAEVASLMAAALEEMVLDRVVAVIMLVLTRQPAEEIMAEAEADLVQIV